MKSSKIIIFLVSGLLFGLIIFYNFDSMKAISEGYIPRWKAIQIVRDDYGRTDPNFEKYYKLKAKLKGDKWVVAIFQPKPTLTGGGGLYEIDGQTGKIIKTLLYQ